MHGRKVSVGTLENLRKEAKRWLKALRAGEAVARARLGRAWPSAPAAPGLRDVHHALARERGHENWTALKTHLGAATASKKAGAEADPAALFLEFACWDHHTHGAGDHRMHDRAAHRHLAQHPEIDAIDQEFRSTPLGLAARWGHRRLVRLLLDRGADRHAAGAEWATPLAWARKKGHDAIAADLAS